MCPSIANTYNDWSRLKSWPKRPTITNPSQLVSRLPKLPPGNPRLLVDVNKDPTFLLGDVLLCNNNNQQSKTEYDVLTRLLGRYRPKDDWLQSCIVVVLHKARFPF